jgi:hypothetical protein
MFVIVFLGLTLAVAALTTLFLMTFLSVAFAGPDRSMTGKAAKSTDSAACSCANCQSTAADQEQLARNTVVSRTRELSDQDLQHAPGGSP